MPDDDNRLSGRVKRYARVGGALGGLAARVAGGRVLCVCAMGDSVSAAQAAAYERVASISWRGVYYRTDIGSRAVARETTA